MISVLADCCCDDYILGAYLGIVSVSGVRRPKIGMFLKKKNVSASSNLHGKAITINSGSFSYISLDAVYFDEYDLVSNASYSYVPDLLHPEFSCGCYDDNVSLNSFDNSFNLLVEKIHSFNMLALYNCTLEYFNKNNISSCCLTNFTSSYVYNAVSAKNSASFDISELEVLRTYFNDVILHPTNYSWT